MRSLYLRRAWMAIVALLALFVTLGVGLATAGPAAAVGTDRYVATTGDDSDNDCTAPSAPCATIDHAIEDEADSNDIIHIAAGTYDEAEIGIDFNLTIEGATDGTTTVDGAGEGIFGAFGSENSAPTVTFKNLNISGNTERVGVLAETADVHFVNSHVDNNVAGGVIAEDATIEASNSTFSGNGEAGKANPFFGGVLVVFGAATIDHSTFDANHGSGITVFPFDVIGDTSVRPQAANDEPASVALDHSTVSNNEWGGVLGLFSSIEVSDSTVAGNTGFGVDNAGGVAAVENSTVTGTKPLPPPTDTNKAAATLGAGIQTENVNTARTRLPSAGTRKAVANRIQGDFGASAAASSARISRRIAAAAAVPNDLENGQSEVTGTIVADQAGVPDCNSAVEGATVDGGFNLSSDADNSCSFSGDSGDLTATDPQLGPLQDNGGPTLTEQPAKGSPAIDAIKVGQANCSKSADDQRGVARPQGTKCDIGAVEVAQPPVVISPNRLPHGEVGHAYSATITATGGLGAPYEFSLAPGSGELPPGLTLDPTGKISGTPTRAGSFPITVSVDDPTLKNYTIVIEKAPIATTSPATNPSTSTAPVANTGANVTPLTTYGLLALIVGALLTFAGIARYAGRHRAH